MKTIPLLTFLALATLASAQVNNNRIWDHILSLTPLPNGDQAQLLMNGGQMPSVSMTSLPVSIRRLSVSDPLTGDQRFTVTDTALLDRFGNEILDSPRWGVLEGERTFVGVVPHPGDLAKFYLITQACDTCGEYSWSLFDMALHNGLGGLTTQRNIPWVSGVMARFHGFLSAPDGSVYWFVTHEPNNTTWRFYPIFAFEPPTTVPVVTQHGPTLGQATENWGWLQVAPSNDRIGYYYESGGNWQLASCTVDPILAHFTNCDTVAVGAWASWPGCFSPEGTKYYHPGGDIQTQTLRVDQYDLTAGSGADILSSLVQLMLPSVVNSDVNFTVIELKNLPDGRVWIEGIGDPYLNEYLLPIHQPDAAGALCQLDSTGLSCGCGSLNEAWILPTLWYPVLPNALNSVTDQEGLISELSLVASPSPGAGRITLTLEGELPEGGPLSIHVHDALGRHVQESPWHSGSSASVVDGGALAPGQYVFELHDGTRRIAMTRWVRE